METIIRVCQKSFLSLTSVCLRLSFILGPKYPLKIWHHRSISSFTVDKKIYHSFATANLTCQLTGCEMCSEKAIESSKWKRKLFHLKCVRPMCHLQDKGFASLHLFAPKVTHYSPKEHN